MVAAISCNWITARTFSGNGRRARACRRCSFAANILATSGLTPSTASIFVQVDVGSEYRQAARDRGEPVRGALQLSRDPWPVRSASRSRSDVLLAQPVRAHLRNRFRVLGRAPLRSANYTLEGIVQGHLQSQYMRLPQCSRARTGLDRLALAKSGC